ncbi:MAG: hypothetical protein GX336_06790 [Halanaerobiaceae bacterium]|nr:hypothetical protein [Halanaerobiaceae bacterium]
MLQLSTFEEIFNKLHEDYRGQMVKITTKQDGIRISSFQTTIHEIEIKPLNKKESKKWAAKEKKVGLIIIKESHRNNCVNIPFLLGFNTMAATFLKDAVIINSLNMEFVIKKIKSNSKLLA